MTHDDDVGTGTSVWQQVAVINPFCWLPTCVQVHRQILVVYCTVVTSHTTHARKAGCRNIVDRQTMIDAMKWATVKPHCCRSRDNDTTRGCVCVILSVHHYICLLCHLHSVWRHFIPCCCCRCTGPPAPNVAGVFVFHLFHEENTEALMLTVCIVML